MKKSEKRILSFILTAVMIFALLPVIGKPMVVKAIPSPQTHGEHEKCDMGALEHKGWKSISDAASLMSIGGKDGYWFLTDDIEITETLKIESGKTVNLCLNGFSITQTENFDTIVVYGTLNLYDKKDNFGKITHDDGKNGRGVLNYGTFTMNGGTITGNKADDYGGGVYNYYCETFTMNGGTIAGNTAPNGGGVLSNGPFTMTEGTISGNNADYGGGVGNYGPFKMTGGTIAGNIADYQGGGVCNMDGLFTMTEGTIKDNQARYEGTGVYSFYSFIKEGGEIEGSIESDKGALCTVTFDANDRSGKTIIQYVNPNEDIRLLQNNFSYGNYPFGCWNTKEDGTGDSYKDNATINIKEDLVLFARWIEKNYEVTFNVNNGSWEDGTKDEKTITVLKYVGDKELKLNASDIPTPANPDTGFKGSWDTKPDTENALTENKTYTYIFEPIEYTVKFDANGGEGTMDDQDRTYDDKAPLTANVFTVEGKTFNGWNTVADGSGTHFKDEEVNNLSSTDGDTVTLYAQWTIDTFTITWKDYDGTVLETDTDVAYGTTPKYDGETPKRDDAGNIKYTFEGWTPAVDTVKGAATYTATYSEEEIVEPEEPKEPTEPTTPDEPQEPTEPEVPVITEPEPEIPEKDWLDDLRLALNIAAEPDSEKTVEYSGDFALPYEIMNFLVNHPDITFVYHITYEGQEYTITIPAGKAVAYADTPWYGPLWLLANYGGNNAPTGAKGNGTYIVKAGDTLTGISVKLGVTIQYLVDKNGIKNADYIIEGQEINY